MFRLFKKKKQKTLPIAKVMSDAAKQGERDYTLAILYKNQILLQLVKSKHYDQFGFSFNQRESFSELHFFNKNKTNTKQFETRFEEKNIANQFYHFENTSGNSCYIKEVGIDFKQIEYLALDSIKKIYKLDLEELKISVYYQ